MGSRRSPPRELVVTTKDRVRALREAHPEMKAAEMARELGITREAVRHHLVTLGITTRQPNKVKPEPTAVFKYDADFPEQAFHLTKVGGVRADLAEAFGCGEDQIDEWIKKYPEFRDAMEKGREARNSYVIKALFHRAKGYSIEQTKVFIDKFGTVTKVPYIENYPPDSHACMFWLRNRDPANWKEVSKSEHTIAGTIELKQLVVSAEELGQKIRGMTYEAEPIEDAQIVSENK